MPDALRLAVAQPPCTPGDVSANAVAHAILIRAAASRVVVFPEMSITGYDLTVPAISPGDPRLAPVVAACTSTGALALIGAPVPGDHIAVLAVDARGARVVYRKQYLHSTEAVRFTGGPGPEVLTVDGWRLGLAVCRDAGVVAHATDTAALGIDAYVVGAVDRPGDGVLHDERAGRITREHRVWVAVASCAGPTSSEYPETAGGSGIWSPDGDVVDRADHRAGGLARATLTRTGGPG